MFKNSDAAAPGPAAPGPAAPTVQAANSHMLLPHDRIPGSRLTLADFCAIYELTENIQTKLDENGYNGSHTFRFAELQDLKDAGLKAGEIAQMKDAIWRWSLPASA